MRILRTVNLNAAFPQPRHRPVNSINIHVHKHNVASKPYEWSKHINCTEDGFPIFSALGSELEYARHQRWTLSRSMYIHISVYAHISICIHVCHCMCIHTQVYIQTLRSMDLRLCQHINIVFTCL